MIYLPLAIMYITIFAKASIDDVRDRKVSNIYYLSLISGTLLYKLVTHTFSLPGLLASVILFLFISEILFSFNLIGGGDAKMLFALSFAFGFDFSPIYILAYLVVILATGIPYYYIALKKGVKSPPFLPIMFLWLFSVLFFI